MKDNLTRQSSQKIIVQQDSRRATLIRTYSLPAAFYRKRYNSMRRRQTKDLGTGEEERICTKENCLRCCKKFTTFMFSRVGLFFVMMGYVALGGVIFQGLEAGNELSMRHIMSLELNKTLYKLWDEVMRVNSLSDHDKKGNFSLNATHELEKFEATVIRQVHEGFDGRTADADHDWNYFGAVLYAVTLVSTIGYGHITTKTTQGKIATILYSAFGIPLMMLFVANIGSTMAKMFAFVFSRLTMLFCCRIGHKKKRIAKNRQKLLEKHIQSSGTMDDKVIISTISEQGKEPMLQTKSNLKTTKDDTVVISATNPSISASITSSSNDVHVPDDIKHLPADVRLNILTGLHSSTTSRSLNSSIHSVGEKPKDAIVRMNELIRQNSIQDFDDSPNEIKDQRRKSFDLGPIQYYIDETNKLTNNLDTQAPIEPIDSIENSQNQENDMKQLNQTQENPIEPDNNEIKSTKKKSSKKILKRSKSESTHNREVSQTTTTSTNDSETSTEKPKSKRRRFFSRKTDKLKESTSVKNEKSDQANVEIQRTTEKVPTLPPPPDYEQSTANEITTLPTTVTWKNEHEFYPTNDLTNIDFDEEDLDDDSDEEEEMSVPLLVTICIIPLYLTLGAILFSIWEQWSFLNSFYFCFITLTTIGFGDFVPGSSLKAEAEKEKLISAAVYILFGLVLIAMCINLMKEQLSQKVKRVASKFSHF